MMDFFPPSLKSRNFSPARMISFFMCRSEEEKQSSVGNEERAAFFVFVFIVHMILWRAQFVKWFVPRWFESRPACFWRRLSATEVGCLLDALRWSYCNADFCFLCSSSRGFSVAETTQEDRGGKSHRCYPRSLWNHDGWKRASLARVLLIFFLIQRREQIDFSQKVVCDSDSAEEIVMGSEVLRIASPWVFEGEFMSLRSFHPSQEETFDCLIEWWVPPYSSEHRKWTSNLRENNDLSFIPFLALHKCSPLSFFFFLLCLFPQGSGLADGRLGRNPATTPGSEGTGGWMSPWNLSARLVQTYGNQLEIPQFDRRQ